MFFFIIFSLISILVLVLSGIQICRTQNTKFPSPLLGLGVLFFVGAHILSFILSSYQYESFWGHMERPTSGLLFLVFLFCLGFSALQFNNPKTTNRILLSNSILSGIIVLCGFGESLFTANDLMSSMGNGGLHPNLLAQYLVLSIPLTFYLWKNKTINPKTLNVILLIQILGILACGSRSAILALGVMTCFGVFIFPQKKKKLSILLLFLFSVFLLTNLLPNKIIQPVPILSRIDFTNTKNNLISNTQSLEIRNTLWKMSLLAIAKSPIIGHGQGAVPYVLQKHMDPELLHLEEYNSIPENAHNIFFQKLLTTGILGLLSFGFLIFTIIKSQTTSSPLLKTIHIALIGYGTTLLFGFGGILDLSLAMVLIIFLSKSKNTTLSKPYKKIIFAAIIISGGVLLVATFQHLSQHYYFSNWKKENNLTALVSAYNVKKDPNILPFLAQEYINQNQSQAAQNIITQALTKTSNNSQFWALLAQTQISQDPEESAKSFEKAFDLAPYSPFVWQKYIQTQDEQGNYTEVVSSTIQLLKFSPQYWKWDTQLNTITAREKKLHNAFFFQNPHFRQNFYYLGEALFHQKKYNQALHYLQFSDYNSATLELIADAHQANGNLEKAENYRQHALFLSSSE